MPANLENSAVATGLEKVSFHSNPKERQCQECSNYCTVALISHASQVMLKISQSQASTVCELWTSRYSSWIWKRQRNQQSNCQHLLDHQKSTRVTERHLLCWLHQSHWLCGSPQTGKFFKRWEHQTTWSASWEICMQVRKQQLEQEMEQ